MRIILLALLFLLNPAVSAQPTDPSIRVGDVYEIRHEYKTESQTGENSKGSSSGHSTLVERVIAIDENGITLEFDLPEKSKEKRKSVDWQYPARILKPYQGLPELLNAAELKSRADAWLEKAKWPRTVCGQWIFTWNAFRIECDPQMVLGLIDGFNLETGISTDYTVLEIEGTLNSATLTRVPVVSEGTTFSAKFVIDPVWLRQQRVESRLVTAQLTGDELKQSEVEKEIANFEFSGMINVKINTDSKGSAITRIKETQVQVRRPDGEIEFRKSTEKLTRKLISGVDG